MLTLNGNLCYSKIKMSDADFSSLLHAAEQLATDVEGNEELPRVERSLGQVLEASQELYSRVTQTGAHDIQAYGNFYLILPFLTYIYVRLFYN